MSDSLTAHDERALHGILQFAEQMQAIRDGGLYPGAGEPATGRVGPWALYCRERWGMSRASVDALILAAPVLNRQLGAEAS